MTTVVALFAVLFSSCDQAPEPIKIGMAINLSGRGGEAGEHIRDGALLAIDEINGSGGIHGRPLKLLIRDDKNSDEGIHEADQSLINQGVVAIIGHSYSSNTVKAYPLAMASNTLLITGHAATTELSGKDDLFLRTTVDCVLYGKKAASLLEKRAVSSISFLLDMTNPDFVVDYLNQVKRHFSGSITEVEFESREQADWQRIIDELLAPQPQAIFMITEASMTGIALQKLKIKGYSGLRIATPWAQTPELMRHAGKAAEGLSIITFINPDNQRPQYLAFADNMEKKFHKQATSRSTRAYEITMILADALRRCQKINSFELKKSLLSAEYDTLMGQVSFDRYGDVLRPIYEVVVMDGGFHHSGEI